jgi:hypothetical protein
MLPTLLVMSQCTSTQYMHFPMRKEEKVFHLLNQDRSLVTQLG